MGGVWRGCNAVRPGPGLRATDKLESLATRTEIHLHGKYVGWLESARLVLHVSDTNDDLIKSWLNQMNETGAAGSGIRRFAAA